MKKVINWFNKRTAIKLVIVQCAAFTIGFLVVRKFGAALIEFALFVSWLVIDWEYNTIEAQDKTIKMVVDDLAIEREENRLAWSFVRFWMQKYLREEVKVDFIKGKISANEF